MMEVIELFAGIGSQRKALERIGIEHECRISEWEINAIISYDAIHTDDGVDLSVNLNKAQILKELETFTFSSDGKSACSISRLPEKRLRQLYNANKRSRNLGSILSIEHPPMCDLLTYSFPCQDVSVAGKGEGLTKGSGTRSGLLWEVERLLLDYKARGILPRYLLMENVKNLVGKQHKPDFDKWLESLEEIGYKTRWTVLNAKNLGVPQNRERVFAVSTLYDNDFSWPETFDNGLRLKDFLEDAVDEKYYLSGEKVNNLISQVKDGLQGSLPTNENSISRALSSREHRGQGWIEGYAPTLCARDYKDPNVVNVKEATKQGYAIAYEGDSINLEQPNSKTRRGRVGRGVAQTLNTSCEQAVVERVPLKFLNRNGKQTDGDYAFCVDTAQTGGVKETTICVDDTQGFDGVRLYDDEIPAQRSQRNGLKVITKTRIRKLTPKECWRLMGFDDVDFEKAEKVNCTSQLYKQAGNSIVVDVLEHIFINVLKEELEIQEMLR